ncbi:MAG: hypothetical protein JNK48_08770 [Bryobacterales bacterium]|nr:hypothetical protein [Bryobacterales bacterium]
MKRYLWILALAIGAGAQQAAVEVATPTLGYIYDDQTRTLRAIEGVPGAASIGAPMHLGTGLDFIAVSPSRSYALGYENGGDNIVLVRLEGTTGGSRASGLPRARAWFSPSGETVAFDLGERAEVWTGLPAEPRRVGEFSTGELRVAKLAVSDDGGMVASLAGGALYRLSGEAPERLGQAVRDIAFERGTRDLLALEASRLVRFGKTQADAEETLLTGLQEAEAFAVARDQRHVAVVGAQVAVADLRSGETAYLDSGESRFDGATRAEGDAVFQLHASTGETWLLEGGGTPRLVALAARGNQ